MTSREYCLMCQVVKVGERLVRTLAKRLVSNPGMREEEPGLVFVEKERLMSRKK